MSTEQDYEDFKAYLDIQHTKVKSNVEEVSAEKLGQSFMLHIDQQTPANFEPRIGKSFSDDEDRTLPRVTVSDSLLGCIVGYYRFLKDFLEIDDGSTNGYYINMLDFDYCLKPNCKLVPYAECANEYWLIGYNKSTLKYKPKTVGKLFISSLEHVMNQKETKHLIRCTFFVEITDDVEIQFSKGKNLKKGYYRITGDFTEYNDSNDNDGSSSINHDDLELFKVTKIDKGDYRKVKNLSASLLDTSCINVPIYGKW